ncbi:MAG: replication-associated recombination protein A, partial [Verrucomicrobia bacterium]|nr:replication-associated recombination protein A [Verrucomicrobiota bacterium]
SNSTTRAIAAVKQSLRKEPIQAVPAWLRDAHNKTSRALGNGEGYQYSHDYPEGISGQEYMLKPQQFYQAGDSGAEVATAKRMGHLRALKARIQSKDKASPNNS